MIKNIKLQKSLVMALKVLLFIIVLYFFFIQVSILSWSQFESLETPHPFYFILVLVLFFVNWGLELLKWNLILKQSKVSVLFWNSFISMFSGIATGIVTPNRIGNFIGRMIFYKGKVRAQIVLGTLYSNFAQFLATLIFGIIGLSLVKQSIIVVHESKLLVYAFGIPVLSLVFYFLVPFLNLNRIKIFKSKVNVLTDFQRLAKSLCLPLLQLSSLRFLVFCLQYFLLLLTFGCLGTLELFAGITLFYLLSTIIPSLFLSKLVVRETAGLMVLSYFVENPAIIIISSLILWIINLGIPSLLGLLFILKNKMTNY